MLLTTVDIFTPCVNKIKLVITGPEVIYADLNLKDKYTCSVKSVFGKNLETENYKPVFQQDSNGTFLINQNVLSFTKDSPSGIYLLQCHFQIETFQTTTQFKVVLVRRDDLDIHLNPGKQVIVLENNSRLTASLRWINPAFRTFADEGHEYPAKCQIEYMGIKNQTSRRIRFSYSISMVHLTPGFARLNCSDMGGMRWRSKLVLFAARSDFTLTCMQNAAIEIDHYFDPVCIYELTTPLKWINTSDDDGYIPMSCFDKQQQLSFDENGRILWGNSRGSLLGYHDIVCENGTFERTILVYDKEILLNTVEQQEFFLTGPGNSVEFNFGYYNQVGTSKVFTRQDILDDKYTCRTHNPDFGSDVFNGNKMSLDIEDRLNVTPVNLTVICEAFNGDLRRNTTIYVANEKDLSLKVIPNLVVLKPDWSNYNQNLTVHLTSKQAHLNEHLIQLDLQCSLDYGEDTISFINNISYSRLSVGKPNVNCHAVGDEYFKVSQRILIIWESWLIPNCYKYNSIIISKRRIKICEQKVDEAYSSFEAFKEFQGVPIECHDSENLLTFDNGELVLQKPFPKTGFYIIYCDAVKYAKKVFLYDSSLRLTLKENRSVWVLGADDRIQFQFEYFDPESSSYKIIPSEYTTCTINYRGDSVVGNNGSISMDQFRLSPSSTKHTANCSLFDGEITRNISFVVLNKTELSLHTDRDGEKYLSDEEHSFPCKIRGPTHLQPIKELINKVRWQNCSSEYEFRFQKNLLMTRKNITLGKKQCSCTLNATHIYLRKDLNFEIIKIATTLKPEKEHRIQQFKERTVFITDGRPHQLNHFYFESKLGDRMSMAIEKNAINWTGPEIIDNRHYITCHLKQIYLGRLLAYKKTDMFNQVMYSSSIAFTPKLKFYVRNQTLQCIIDKEMSLLEFPYMFITHHPEGFKPRLYYDGHIDFSEEFVGGVYDVTCFHQTIQMIMIQSHMTLVFYQPPSKLRIEGREMDNNSYAFQCTPNGFPIENITYKWRVISGHKFAFHTEGNKFVRNKFAIYGNYTVQCTVVILHNNRTFHLNASANHTYTVKKYCYSDIINEEKLAAEQSGFIHTMANQSDITLDFSSVNPVTLNRIKNAFRQFNAVHHSVRRKQSENKKTLARRRYRRSKRQISSQSLDTDELSFRLNPISLNLLRLRDSTTSISQKID
ncbi:unnamed protein product [Trichobilharzia szidati]|nr:unnamed protein product [Trichobilharzia szidati]